MSRRTRTRDRSAWHVLRQRDVSLYFGGNACSNVGTWLQNTAQVLLAFQLTRSAGGVALVTFSQFSGIILLGPCAGMIADRVERRRVLLVTQLLSASVSGGMAALEFTGHLTKPWLVLGAFGIGVIYAFTLPAQTAMIPTLVAQPDVRAAMAMNTASNNVGRALAPLLGVAVIATIGFGWAFALNSVSFAVFFVALVLMRKQGSDAARLPFAPSRLLDGFRIVAGNHRMILLLVMVALATVSTDPIMVLGPSLSRHVFHASEAWAAYFIAALGSGTILGSLIRLGKPRMRQAILSLTVLFAAIMVFVCAPTAEASALAAVAAGVASLLVAAATQTLLLDLGGPRYSGCVMAVWAFFYAGSRPAASLADGWLADTFGARVAGVVIIFASSCVLVIAVLWALRKRVSELRERTPLVVPERGTAVRVPPVLREAYSILTSG